MSSDRQAAHSRLVDPRRALIAIHDLLERNPALRPRYEAAKQVIRIFRKPAFYEITQRCNLFCEGCYYFEGGDTRHVREEPSLSAWDAFFAAEAQRGVSMVYLVGAEPGLEEERLFAASRHFTHGNVGCNGSLRLDPAIQFRIMVSVWAGDDETDRKLRGGAVFRKAFRNYRGDPRAFILYTLTRWNLPGARTIAEMCRDNGIALTFNMYSPTNAFLSKLRANASNDREYFRVSRPDDAPTFSDNDLAEVRRTVLGLMEDFPETVVYSKQYNDWVTQPAPLYEINPETGIADRCGSRIVDPMTYHTADLKRSPVKCCTPDVDCAQCRMYSGGWSSRFQPSALDLASAQAFSDWLDMIAVLGRIVVYEPPPRTVGVPAMPCEQQIGQPAA